MAPQRGLGRRQIEPNRVPAAVEPFDPARAGAGLDDTGIRVPPGEIERRSLACGARNPNSLAKSSMKDLLLALLHPAVTTAKRCGPGGVRAVIAENLLLKQQLIVLRGARQRAPTLRVGDRLLCGFGSLLLSSGRIRKVGIGVRPSTLLTFHQALVRRKYRRLFSSSPRPKKPGPKGPSEALIRAIVDLKARNS